MNLSTFTGTCAVIKSGPYKGQTGCTSGIPKYYDQSDLKATLSNNTGVFLLGKYKFAQFPLTLSGGWEYIKQSNPSGTSPTASRRSAAITSPARSRKKNFPTQWITYTPITSTGSPTSSSSAPNMRSRLSSTSPRAYYYLEQNNYNSTTTPCATANTTFVQPNGNPLVVSRINNSSCAGSQDAISVPHRLSAGQARRPLRRRDDLQCLRRPGQRLPGDPENRPDRRPARQVLSRLSRRSRRPWSRGPVALQGLAERAPPSQWPISAALVKLAVTRVTAYCWQPGDRVSRALTKITVNSLDD